MYGFVRKIVVVVVFELLFPFLFFRIVAVELLLVTAVLLFSSPSLLSMVREFGSWSWGDVCGVVLMLGG